MVLPKGTKLGLGRSMKKYAQKGLDVADLTGIVLSAVIDETAQDYDYSEEAIYIGGGKWEVSDGRKAASVSGKKLWRFWMGLTELQEEVEQVK